MNNSENKAKSKARQIPVEFQGQVYLDPKYDPAFKELFDSEDALKDFLDAVLKLEGDDKIKTISFSFDKTISFRTPQRKKVILDIFATTGSGRFLDIEMQKAEHDYFKDRAVLYKAFLIIKGKQEMDRSPQASRFPSSRKISIL
ncbi:MAG: Rpn family recombination-promoting nuclease/putative transposase [Fibrobacter sp.]|nr:Rpn family recombination-promoting nuclease/putative transposase [Fibrobacter sp.]